MKSSTYTLSHAHRNNLKNDNRSSEHFRQIFASQNTRNGVSEHENFKIFWKSKPPDPPPCPSGSSVIKKKIRFYVLTKLDSLSFFVNMVSSRNLDYIFYSAFNSSKGKKYVR